MEVQGQSCSADALLAPLCGLQRSSSRCQATLQALSSLGQPTVSMAIFLSEPRAFLLPLNQAPRAAPPQDITQEWADTGTKGVNKATHVSEQLPGMSGLSTSQHDAVICKVKHKNHPSRLGRWLRWVFFLCKGEDLNLGPQYPHKASARVSIQ